MVITERMVQSMIGHARSGFPNEVCGLIATSDGAAVKVFNIDNADASPVHYHMDAQQQLRAMLEIDDNDWELGAIYHSHTRTPAYPSQTDVKLALYPEAVYIILSLADEHNPDLRAYRIVDNQISEEALEIVP